LTSSASEQVVEDEEYIGTLLSTNENIIVALQLYDKMSKPSSADSDDDAPATAQTVPNRSSMTEEEAIAESLAASHLQKEREGELARLQAKQRMAVDRHRQASFRREASQSTQQGGGGGGGAFGDLDGLDFGGSGSGLVFSLQLDGFSDGKKASSRLILARSLSFPFAATTPPPLAPQSTLNPTPTPAPMAPSPTSPTTTPRTTTTRSEPSLAVNPPPSPPPTTTTPIKAACMAA
jgi:hypothetical protein